VCAELNWSSLFCGLFTEDDIVRIARQDALKMPVYSIPVTLAELLEVQGTALSDSELWALLYASSQSLSRLFTQGSTSTLLLLGRALAYLHL